MKKVLVISLIVAALILIATLGVVASGKLVEGTIPSFIVDIDQSVPVEITAPVTLESGEVVTVSAPFTLTLQLRVSVDGQGTVHVMQENVQEPTVTIITPTVTAHTPSGPTGSEEEVLAQLAAYKDEVCEDSLTSIQRNDVLKKYNELFANRDVQLSGTIDDVRESSGKYDVIVSPKSSDVNIQVVEVSQEQALSLRKGDPVTLNGNLEFIGCNFFVKLSGELTSP